MSYSFWRPQPWRPGRLPLLPPSYATGSYLLYLLPPAPPAPLATPLVAIYYISQVSYRMLSLLTVMGKIVFKTILKIENKIVFKTILKILLQNSFQEYFENRK